MLGVFLLCVAFLAAIVLLWRAGKPSAYPLPPALSGSFPILGHAPLFTGETASSCQIFSTEYKNVVTGERSLWQIINDMSRECMQKGGVMHAYLGPQLYYLISDPEDAFTAVNACVQKHYIYNYLRPWVGDGLLTSSGSIWQRHRRLLNPAFAVSVIHNFMGIFNFMSKQLISEMQCYAGKGPFNPIPHMREIAFQTFSRTAFGIREANVKGFAKSYMESSDKLTDMVVYRFLNIWLHSEFIYKLCGFKRKENYYINILDDMASKVLDKKKMEIKKNSSNQNATEATRCKPLMNLLLELKDEDTLSDKEIKEEVNTAIAAGFDTTSNTLTCILVLLGSFPEIQQRVYEEIIEVVGPHRDLEKDDIKQLVFLEAVIKEALRIFPIGPALLRQVDTDVKLKNYTMRAGSQCAILPLGTHRDAVWGEDVEEFKPERWLDPAVAALTNNSFYGFSLGKRSCIGKAYAMTSMKITLSHYIRRYRIHSDVNQMKFKVDILLKPTYASISLENRQ